MPVSPRTDPLSKKIEFLKQVPLFAALTEKDLIALSQDLSLREYPKDEIIFRQGDVSNTLFIILNGRVRIFLVTPSGNETTLNIYGTGDLLGEFAPLDERPRSATAQASSPSTLLQIPGDKFLRHLNAMPPLALGMIRLLIGKVRWTTTFAETIAQYDAVGRLLHILLLYNDRFGEEQVKAKRYVLDLGLNQSDLASLVGVRRESINRILQDWQRRGLIEYRAGKITILDLPRVRQERDSRIEANLNKDVW